MCRGCAAGGVGARGWPESATRPSLVLVGAYRLRRGRFLFFFSSRRRHTRCSRDWSSDVCSSDLPLGRVTFMRLLLTHLIAAVFISFIWTHVGALLAYAVLSPKQFEAIKSQFGPQVNAINTIGILLYLLSVAFHYVLIAMEDSRRAEAQATEARILARDAELKALKAQVNPHFLFNSLNSVSELTSIDPSKAREMCILLSEFLRLTLGLGEKTVIPLSEELALLERFLAIEKVRFGARLRSEEHTSELQSRLHLVCRLLLEKKKQTTLQEKRDRQHRRGPDERRPGEHAIRKNPLRVDRTIAPRAGSFRFDYDELTTRCPQSL